jgi:membrane peptidoglycan carboxypeptidase
MPSVSKSQQRLMQAAEHGADFPMAKQVQSSMTHDQMHDFAVGPMGDKPQHVGAAPIKGTRPDVMASNTQTFKNQGMNEMDATIASIKASKGATLKAGHPNRFKNLGKHLHPRKDGKPHGTAKD